MTREEMVTKLMEQLAATETVDHAQQLIDAVNDKTTSYGELIRLACRCKKDELLRVFAEITGRQFAEYVDTAISCDDEQLNVEIALHLDMMRGHKAFLVKSFEEKYEMVMNAKDRNEWYEYLKFFSVDEVYAMADKLGIPHKETVNRTRCSVDDKLRNTKKAVVSVSVDVSDPVQVEVIDTPVVKAPKMQKGRKTMTKVTVKELRAQAKAYGINGYSKLNKAQLEELIRKHEQAVQAQQKVVSVITPDYDAAFDEPAYSPDIQEVTVIVDDIPADHEPDIAPVQEVGVSYEDVRQAYTTYENAMWDYKDSCDTDVAKKHEAEAAYREYLRLLVEYRKGAMPEREGVLNWIRDRCGEAALPVERLVTNSFDYLVELSHKCGIHAANFQGISRNDMAVRLIREAGIETCATTFYEFAIKQRKELQARLHELWQKRHALRKAQRLLGEGSADAEALNDVWEQYQEDTDFLMSEYKKHCRKCAEGRRYEADSRGISPAPVQEEKPIVAVEAPEPEVQVVLASAPKTARVYRKKTRTPRQKSHRPSWVQSPLTTKPSRQRVSKKPLVKLSKVASPARIRKF